MYMLIVYIIHVEYINIMMSHHLWLDDECNFIDATTVFLVIDVHCNLFIITNYCHKYTFKKSVHFIIWGFYHQLLCYHWHNKTPNILLLMDLFFWICNFSWLDFILSFSFLNFGSFCLLTWDFWFFFSLVRFS
jgi:hypothetical protein